VPVEEPSTASEADVTPETGPPYLGNTAVGDYSGTLTPSGGTLTGTQTWTGPQNTTPASRACAAALVPAPQFAVAAAPR
jgi:hypothetical protein